MPAQPHRLAQLEVLLVPAGQVRALDLHAATSPIGRKNLDLVGRGAAQIGLVLDDARHRVEAFRAVAQVRRLVALLLVQLDLLTFCVLMLRNGFMVTGESACASPENFDAEIGRKVARQNAVSKIWPLLGFALKQKLHEAAE